MNKNTTIRWVLKDKNEKYYRYYESEDETGFVDDIGDATFFTLYEDAENEKLKLGDDLALACVLIIESEMVGSLIVQNSLSLLSSIRKGLTRIE